MPHSDDYTVVVGVDAHTIEQLLITFPTWRKIRRGLFRKPWIVFYDPSMITGIMPYQRDKLERLLNVRKLQFVPWTGDYHSQREKMVTGHVYVAQHVKTPWFLKIDTDAIAYERVQSFPDPAWFTADKNNQYNVMVASSWGYTRAKGGGPLKDDLDAWCEALESFGDAVFSTDRLDIAKLIGSRDHPKGPKMRMTRLASWLCLQRTGWVREMSKLFSSYSGDNRLPVPSHDTCLWYSAVRSGARFSFANMKGYGWMVRAHNKSIRSEAGKVMRVLG